MQIITGRTGENHVTSDDDRALYAGIFGTGSYVLNTGLQLAAAVISANTIRISSGDLVHQGTHARIRYNTYEDVTIDNGTTGYGRIDLIVARYSRSAGLESMELAVIKGTPSADPEAPVYNTGNILQGASVSEMPLYQITLDGVNIESVTALYTLIGVPMSDVMGKTEYVPIIGGLGQQLRDFSTYVDGKFTTVNAALDSLYSDIHGVDDGILARLSALSAQLSGIDNRVTALEERNAG